MVRFRTFASVAVLMLLAAAFTGCAGPKHAQYTSTGAGIGAVTGGILGLALGSLTGREAEGVVIGSMLGGLYGAAVGDAEYHMQKSEEEAVREYDYEPDEGRRDLLRIEEVYAEPKLVAPGETLDMNVTYTLLTRWRSGQVVHEVREIRKEGELIGSPQTSVRRNGGTWTSSVPITIPTDADEGAYVITTIVETEEAGDVQETTFRVERSGWKR